jgi:hypothetical protein
MFRLTLKATGTAYRAIPLAFAKEDEAVAAAYRILERACSSDFSAVAELRGPNGVMVIDCQTLRAIEALRC